VSLVRRKPRPLARDTDRLRDDRLFRVACEDRHAVEQYFRFFRLPRVQVHVVPTEDGAAAARHVLNRLLQFEVAEDDERWMVIDTDHYIEGKHVAGFVQTLQEARQKGVRVAVSRPCFELWLLLHHVEEAAVVGLEDAAAVVAELRAVLGGYSKRGLRAADFSAGSVLAAWERAERLDAAVAGGDVPQGNTTRVYQLWASIWERVHAGQLPEDWRR
jgi:hypothetical protein